jgi:hypothetical protein
VTLNEASETFVTSKTDNYIAPVCLYYYTYQSILYLEISTQTIQLPVIKLGNGCCMEKLKSFCLLSSRVVTLPHFDEAHVEDFVVPFSLSLIG